MGNGQFGRGLSVTAVVLGLGAAVLGGCGSGDDTIPAAAGQSSTPASAPPTTASGEGATGTSPPGPTTTPPDRTRTTVFDHPPGSDLPDRPPPPEPVTTRGSVATGLKAVVGCDPAAPTRGIVKLSWTAAPSGGEQLVGFTTRKHGFETGPYAVSAALPAGRASYQLGGTQAGGAYYWRVLTRFGQGWAASAAQSFSGPTCVTGP
jgi:hypothetical protein